MAQSGREACRLAMDYFRPPGWRRRTVGTGSWRTRRAMQRLANTVDGADEEEEKKPGNEGALPAAANRARDEARTRHDPFAGEGISSGPTQTDTAGSFLSDRTKRPKKQRPAGRSKRVRGGGHTHLRPKFGAAMGLRGHARTGHASSPGPPVIDPRRYVFSNATRPPASVRLVASSQSACALGAPPSPSMPAAASTPA
jgi:hypothetical protein